MTEVFLNAANRRELALSPCNGLERDLVHARTYLKHVLHFVEDGQQSLQVMRRLMRVNVSDTGQLRNHLVHSWVVFHRARAERIETRVNTEVSL